MCSGAAAGTGAGAGSRPGVGADGRRCVAPGPAHHPVDRLEQLVLLDRLEQVGVDPQLAEAGRVAGAVPGGQQDDAGGGQLGSLADLGGQRQAVRVGHAGVEQHQRVRPAAWRRRRQRASRAASPSPTAAGSICQPRSHSSRMWRLVALSSTTSTGRLSEQDRRLGGGRAPGGAAGARTAP